MSHRHCFADGRTAARPCNYLLLYVVSIFFTACTSAPTPTQTPAPRICGSHTILEEVGLTCVESETSILLQTAPDAQAKITLANGTLTVRGTVLVQRDDDALTLAVMTLEGVGIIGARGTTRIVQPGSQIIVSLDDAQTITNLSGVALPIDERILPEIALNTLPRAITPPAPIAPPPGFTPPPTSTYTPSPIPPTVFARGTLPPTSLPSPTTCAPRADWGGRHRIVSGDRLSNIAVSYGLSVDDLALGNCLTDPDRIRVGDVLVVPGDVLTATPEGAPSLTPSVVFFRADRTALAAGDCTVLRWDVYNISAVFIQEAGTGFEEQTTGSNVKQVCPVATALYILRVVYPDGSQSLHEVTLTITSATALP
jgi:LysM repeat protein